MGYLSKDKLRYWFDPGENTPEWIMEIIEEGGALWFQYEGRDYFIERYGEEGYAILDQFVGREDERPEGVNAVDLPFSMVAKTAHEMATLPFLNGKSIFERFNELRFFER